MLVKSYDIQTVQFIQDDQRPEVVVITAEDSQLWVRGEIGRFNFHSKYGYIMLPNGKKKEYQRFQSIMNNFFKLDPFFGYTVTGIENAQAAAKAIIKQEKAERQNELKQLDQEKYNALVNKINNDESFLESFKNKTDEELKRLADNTFKHDKSLATKIFDLIVSALNEEDEQTEQRNYKPSYSNISFNEEAVKTNKHFDRYNEYRSEYLVSEARKQVRRINDFKGQDVELYVNKLEMLLYILKERNYISYDLKEAIQTLEVIKQEQSTVTTEAPATSEQVKEPVKNEINTNNQYYTVCNKPFLTLEDAQNFCIQCDFDYNMIEEVNSSTSIYEPVKYPMPIYWYSYTLRGFSPFCQPKGHIKVNHDIGRHGIIAYNRQLTDNELSDYELVPYTDLEKVS